MDTQFEEIQEKITFWYLPLAGGGVESGDSTMSPGDGVFVTRVETAEQLEKAIQGVLDEQVHGFETEQNMILLDVEKELAELDPEPDCLAPIPIRHQVFSGMGASMLKKLNAAGVKTVEQMDELGVSGLVGLDINNLTEKKAKSWHARAREVLVRIG